MRDEMLRLYDEARQLHEQAKAILTEFAGEEMPAEKEQELDRLFDAIDEKVERAKKIEDRLAKEQRQQDNDRLLGQPTNVKAFFRDDTDEGQAQPDPADGYTKAYRSYLLKGSPGLNADEVKALAVGEAPAGGYLVSDTLRAEIVAKQRERQVMRRLCRVLDPVPSGSSITPTEEDTLTDAEWTPEVATGSADVVKPFGQRALTPHALSKRILLSRTFLRNPNFDVEAWVRDAIAYKFAVPEENAFINGDGAGKPLGILSTGGLTYYTTAGSNAVVGDDIINWVYSLPSTYFDDPSCAILCNRAFIRKVRALHTMAAGAESTNYIWQPGLAPGEPNRILDKPYALSDRFDDGLDASDEWEDNAVVAVVGAWAFYWIVDALQLEIQRLSELYAETNQIGFIGRKEADGMCVRPEAFLGLKIKA